MEKYRAGKTLILFLGLAIIPTDIPFAIENQLLFGKGVIYASTDQPIIKDKKDDKDKDQTVKEPPARLFAYKPPLRGTPGNRVGGGTRGTDRDMPVIAAIVPDHTGLTTKGQPTLYWHLSNPTNYNIEFTLNDEQNIDPIIEVNIKNNGTQGFHAIRISDYNINLKQGVEYQWFVTVVRDPEQRSKDIIATGLARRIEPSSTLNRLLNNADKGDMPYIFAEQGIWYDALSSLSDLIAENPNDSNLIRMRTSLLEQAGLLEAISVK
jgi:hypothetical protein